jgi:hypothetical protein
MKIKIFNSSTNPVKPSQKHFGPDYRIFKTTDISSDFILKKQDTCRVRWLAENKGCIWFKKYFAAGFFYIM